MSCGVSPFQPYPENVIWLSAGRTVPAGWVETSRFEFDCGAAVVVMPDGYSSGGTIPTAITPPVINFAGNSWNVTPGTYSNYDNIATTVMIGSDVVGLTGVFTAADDGKTMTVSETAYNSYGSISQYANRPVEYDPLAPYYASGTIGIHFATDAVTTDGVVWSRACTTKARLARCSTPQ